MYHGTVTDLTEPPLVDGESLTIDQLAQRTGMTVRNIRAHQSRGLLPAPQLRGRTGYYGPEHVARIELIKDLQAQGFNLEGIRHLLEESDGSTEHVVRFTRAIREPFVEEQPREVSLDELLARTGADPDPALLERSIELGLLRPLGDGVFEERSPRLSDTGPQLAELGITVADALEAVAAIRTHAEGIADTYVRLFIDKVWTPFEEAGEPAERWSEVQEALEKLRPLATDTVVAVFQLVMTEATERALGRELERLMDEGEGGLKGQRPIEAGTGG